MTVIRCIREPRPEDNLKLLYAVPAVSGAVHGLLKAGAVHLQKGAGHVKAGAGHLKKRAGHLKKRAGRRIKLMSSTLSFIPI